MRINIKLWYAFQPALLSELQNINQHYRTNQNEEFNHDDVCNRHIKKSVGLWKGFGVKYGSDVHHLIFTLVKSTKAQPVLADVLSLNHSFKIIYNVLITISWSSCIPCTCKSVHIYIYICMYVYKTCGSVQENCTSLQNNSTMFFLGTLYSAACWEMWSQRRTTFPLFLAEELHVQ